MNAARVYIPENPPAVEVQDVLHYLGYGTARPDDDTLGLINGCKLKLEAVMEPKAVYASYPLEFIDGHPVLENCGFKLVGSEIAAHLKGCSTAVMYAATLSLSTDMLIRQMQAKDMAAGVVLDCCATAAIEKLSEMVERKIKSEYPGSYFTTRYSPGYGDFPIELQKDFLDTLNAQKLIGLFTNEAYLLTPIKSVTAIIGVGDEPPKDLKTGCAFCRLKDNCSFRKRGQYCGLSKTDE